MDTVGFAMGIEDYIRQNMRKIIVAKVLLKFDSTQHFRKQEGYLGYVSTSLEHWHCPLNFGQWLDSLVLAASTNFSSNLS